MTNGIEKRITLKAPVSRVWKALTDYREFGDWFRVKLEGPFTAGQPSRGHMTEPGYEHVVWNAEILKIEPEHYFSYTWHPYGIDPAIDYSSETPTLVEFRLEASGSSTILVVTETGFDNIPSYRRQEAFEKHEGGWAHQMKNIETYVTPQA